MKWWKYLLIGIVGFIALIVMLLFREAKPTTQNLVQKALREFPQLMPEYEEKMKDGMLSYLEAIPILSKAKKLRAGEK